MRMKISFNFIKKAQKRQHLFKLYDETKDETEDKTKDETKNEKDETEDDKDETKDDKKISLFEKALLCNHKKFHQEKVEEKKSYSFFDYFNNTILIP